MTSLQENVLGPFHMGNAGTRVISDNLSQERSVKWLHNVLSYNIAVLSYNIIALCVFSEFVFMLDVLYCFVQSVSFDALAENEL